MSNTSSVADTAARRRSSGAVAPWTTGWRKALLSLAIAGLALTAQLYIGLDVAGLHRALSADHVDWVLHHTVLVDTLAAAVIWPAAAIALTWRGRAARRRALAAGA